MAQRNRTFLEIIIIVTALTAATSARVEASAQRFDSGVSVRIHTADDLSADIRDDGGARLLTHPALGSLELLTGVDDPRLPRRGVEEFLPLDGRVVAAAFSDLRLDGVDLTVDVFLLPAPPAEILGSFARRSAIVLSPAFGPVDEATIAELVVHELGHVLTWAYFDHAQRAWDEYMDLRGLDAVSNGPSAAHADRAREILAEDLRYLIGGDLATSHQGIENGDLVLPDHVSGLEAFLRSTVRGRPMLGPALTADAWPNPCNPQTTVRLRLGDMDAGDPGAARLQILDLRGRVVRTVRGGGLDNGVLSIQWDGVGDDGRRVSSGRYAYRIGWTGREAAGTVALVR
jgi:hypothetical protein